MMKIVLPTDFSENAFHAIGYAANLLENVTCVFYLLHAYTPAMYRIDYAFGSPGQLGLPDEHHTIAETSLEKTRMRIERKFDNPKHIYFAHAAFNTLEDEIKTMVKNENVDAIIMGTQGATGAKEILFGSTTVGIFKKADVPVLAVPSWYRFAPPKEILFPTDYEVDYEKADLDFLMHVSKSWGSHIHVMHVSPPDGLTQDQERNKKVLEKILKGKAHTVHDLPDQDLVQAINTFQKNVSMDLLVMIKNKHSFLERLFLEPVIQNIGLHSKIPFLVLPYNPKT
ncbi:MAG: universal stress protein [Allomuricauda sp.]